MALVVSVIATAGFHISGGHVNPAVTLSLAVGGHITLFRSSLYIAAQMLCSSAACFLLRWLTGGLATPVHALAEGVVAETVFTFSLLLVIYATILDPRKLLPGAGPLLTGLGPQLRLRCRPVRRVHEPGEVVRARRRHGRLDASLGVLGRPARRARVRVLLHGGRSHARAAAPGRPMISILVQKLKPVRRCIG